MTKTSVAVGLRVRDVMSPAPHTLQRNDRLETADDLMTVGRFRHLPVLNGTRRAGRRREPARRVSERAPAGARLRYRLP